MGHAQLRPSGGDLEPDPYQGGRKRVAVLDFAGPQSRQIRGAWLRFFEGEEDFQLVPQSRVRAIRDGRGHSSLDSAEALTQVAQDLDLTAVVEGRVRRARRSWSAAIRVRSGADGSVLAQRQVSQRTVGALVAAQRRVFRSIREQLRSAQSPLASQNVPPPREPEVVLPIPVEPPAPGPSSPPAPDPVPDEVVPDEPTEPDPAVGGAPDYPWLSFTVIGGSQFRSLSANAIVSNDCAGTPGPGCRDPGGPSAVSENREYQSSGIGHGQLGARVEFFPGAIGAVDELPWLGVVAEFRKGILLSTRGCRARSPGSDPCLASDQFDLSTDQLEIYAGARGRYRWVETRGAPEVYADLGFGIFQFSFDLEQLQTLEWQAVVAPVNYSYVLLGAGVSYGFVPRYLRIGLRANYRVGLSVGSDAQAIWGRNTGSAAGMGLGFDFTSDAPYLLDGLFFQLSVDLLRFTTRFRGQTQCAFQACIPGTDPWERWPTEVGDETNVIGGIRQPVDDEYLQVSLAAGYRFH